MKDPKFAEHLAVFVDVVRGGSFSSAARKRSVTPSAIVRQVDGLEHSLSTPVLVRSTHALALTDAGERLFERAQRLLDELADTYAEIAAMTDAIAGVLRIACSPPSASATSCRCSTASRSSTPICESSWI